MIEVIKAALAKAPDGYATALFDGTGQDLPLVIGTGQGRGDEATPAVGGSTEAWSSRLSLCCMADDPELALDLAEVMVDALTPHRRPARLDVPGRVVTLVHESTTEPAIDTGLFRTGTDARPGYCWVRFRVHSQPFPEED